MTLKCDVPITHETWKGWPLRIAHFAPQGSTGAVVSAHDTLHVWSGGKSEVTLRARRREHVEQLQFVRSAGTVDLVPKGTVLDGVSWRGQACTCIQVSFDPEILERLLGAPSALAPDCLRLALPDAYVVELVHQLLAQLRTGQPWGHAYVEALSLTLARYVQGRYGAPDATLEVDQGAGTLEWQHVVSFVEDHLSHSIGVDDLASVMGYSPDHFTRRFKRAFGITPYQYVIERRVERAKSLLVSSSLSIAEVATACGFSTQAHLYAAFKARLGATPGAYRKRLTFAVTERRPSGSGAVTGSSSAIWPAGAGGGIETPQVRAQVV